MSAQICVDRARFERSHRAAKALETTYTVQGWRQADGSLWLPNKLVRVTDPVIGFEGEMLIVEATWKLSEVGTTTALRVGPAAGYMAYRKSKKNAASGENWNDAHAAQ